MKELGEMIGVTESAIGMYEKGRRSPDYEKLLKIGEALHCSVAELIDEGETIETPPTDLGGAEQFEFIRAWNAATPQARKAALAVLRLSAPIAEPPADTLP